MASEGNDCRSGACAGSCVGMADEHDGYKMVRGVFPCQSSAVSGLLRDSSYTHCPDIVGIEEMGLLDCMALCEYSESDALSEGRTGLHADSQLPVPYKRHMVAVHMVQVVPQKCMTRTCPDDASCPRKDRISWTG